MCGSYQVKEWLFIYEIFTVAVTFDKDFFVYNMKKLSISIKYIYMRTKIGIVIFHFTPNNDDCDQKNHSCVYTIFLEPTVSGYNHSTYPSQNKS